MMLLENVNSSSGARIQHAHQAAPVAAALPASCAGRRVRRTSRAIKAMSQGPIETPANSQIVPSASRCALP